jgi:hypothetical protein
MIPVALLMDRESRAHVELNNNNKGEEKYRAFASSRNDLLSWPALIKLKGPKFFFSFANEDVGNCRSTSRN